VTRSVVRSWSVVDVTVADGCETLDEVEVSRLSKLSIVA
jgi:hypothetical protein